MAKLPAVQGLLKHQLYFRDPLTGLSEAAVVTVWTWRNEHPVPAARVSYEAAHILANMRTTTFRNYTSVGAYCTWVRTWDMGFATPLRVGNLIGWPVLNNNGGLLSAPQLTAVIALRTQPVGSSTRNRQNGRIHHPYPHSSFAQGGVVEATSRTQYVNIWTGVLNGLKPSAHADAGQWVVPCHFLGGALRPGGPLLPAVDHVLCRTLPGVLRSRAYHPGPYDRGV